MPNEVAIRLSVKGEDAAAAFDRFKQQGVGAFASVGDASDKTAQRLTNGLARAEKDAEASLQRLAAAQAKVAAVTGPSPIQQRIDTSTSSVGGNNARDSASAFRDLLAEQDRYAARAQTIRDMLDPMAAAQRRYNAEIGEARELMAAGALTAGEFAQRQTQLQAALDKTSEALRAQSRNITLGPNADAQVQAFRASQDAAAETARYAQRAQMLRDMLDPTAAAQRHLNEELREAQTLVSRGALSLDDYSRYLVRNQAEMNGLANATDATARSSARNRQVTQQVGFQLQDFAVQVSGGTSALVAFSQQFPQLASALAQGEGRLAAMAGVLGGVWGVAAITAATVLIPLVSKLLDTGNAADEAKKKMLANADALETARKVTLTKAEAARILGAAIEDLNKTTAASIRTTRQAADAAFIDAVNMRNQEIQTRNLTKAKLQLAIAQEQVRATTAVLPGTDPLLASMDNASGEKRLQGLQRLMKEQDKSIANAQAAVNRTKVPILQRFATEGIDASAAATGRYEREVGRLNKQKERGAISDAAYVAGIAKAQQARDAATKSTQTGTRAEAGHAAAISATARAASEAADRFRQLDIRARNIGYEVGRTEYRPTDFGAVMPDLSQFEQQRDMQRELAQQAMQDQRTDITSLASFYQRAFEGGTGSIWGTFKAQGEKVIAQLLAKWTLNQFGDASGKLTLTGVLGKVAGVFGGGSTSDSAIFGRSETLQSLAAGTFALPKNAAGTPRWSGGMTWINENGGGEIVDLPGGSRIYPAAETRRMMAANNNGGGEVRVTVTPSDYFNVAVERIATPIAQAVGQSAVVGGADMADKRIAQRRRAALA